MLRLNGIIKDYKVADATVRALRGINLSFRESEFVSVLGPSGCGKTTLLNIVGGLDHCTSGELNIMGRSTSGFSDRDWDVYRNHRIGFIFQSYNLIPHQTVLKNVELALTIAGMSKAERVAKAKAALDKVGLSDQYNKRPNQLSGGQCQRVAIARALVNDPEILLADEPTGALDTVTSKQIMELVKEVSKERLVIMVTHNPELAEEYSTRIIRLLDGELLSDSNPFSDEDEKKEVEQIHQRQAELAAQSSGVKKERAKMSFFTAFKLSLQNLFTKKKRTAMTSIAGSIGIIGVSMVLSISYGLQSYIDNMQSDMLSGNPIEIAQTAFNINEMMSDTSAEEQLALVKKNGWVNIDAMVAELAERANRMENLLVQNTITRDYVDYVKEMNPQYLAALVFNQGLDLSNNLYTDFYDPSHTDGRQLSLSGIKAIYSSILKETKFEQYVTMIDSLGQPFAQAPDSEEYLLSQYDVLYSAPNSSGIAKEENEIMIVLGRERTLNDLLLGQLGYFSQDEFINIVYGATDDDRYDPSIYRDEISFDELTQKEFLWYPNDDIFSTPPAYDQLSSFVYDEEHSGNGGLRLKVVGILEPKEGLNYGMLSRGFFYTQKLAEYVVQQNYDSEIVRFLRDSDNTSYTNTAASMANSTTILYSGVTFSYSFYSYVEQQMVTNQALVGSVDQMSAMMGMFQGMLGGSGGGGEGGGGGSSGGGFDIVAMTTLSLQQLGGNVDVAIERDEDGDLISWNVLLEDGMPYALPSAIYVYPADLEQKALVLDYLDAWNEEGDLVVNGKTITFEMREKITYSDMLSLIMSMLTSLLDIITVALVGFTSLALVVSCVMIAIITYVSVVERIKEIGVIRSLGGRKRDVSNLFTAETFIIGFASGAFGIIVTFILSAIVNMIVSVFAPISTIAIFPWHYALIMLSVSVGLTLISGLMPSQSAAKKDPVVALRTE